MCEAFGPNPALQPTAAAMLVKDARRERRGPRSTMNQDDTFRIILLLGLLIVLPIGVYHRLKSQATGEKLDRRQEGVFMLITLRAAGVVSWLGTMAYLVNPSWMAWSSVALPEWLRWTGVVLFVMAGGLLIWTFRSLGKNLTDTVVTRREHTLVITGPYAFVRHPFYDTGILGIVAIFLITANWFILLMGAVVMVLLIVRTKTEEHNLLARFGDSYREYMKRTGRFLPRIG